MRNWAFQKILKEENRRFTHLNSRKYRLKSNFEIRNLIQYEPDLCKSSRINRNYLIDLKILVKQTIIIYGSDTAVWLSRWLCQEMLLNYH